MLMSFCVNRIFTVLTGLPNSFNTCISLMSSSQEFSSFNFFFFFKLEKNFERGKKLDLTKRN